MGKSMFDLSVQAAGIVKGKGPQLEWPVEKKNLLENSNNEFYDLAANKSFTIRNEFGWHKGAFFRKWISKLIKKRTGNPDATFAEVQQQKTAKGFRLDSEKEIAVFRDQAEPAHAEITGFLSYSLNLIKTIMDNQSNTHLHSDDWQRTIYVDTLGVKTTDFSLTDAKKKALVESGCKGAETYLKWFDNPKSDPVNRA